jgi:spore maturation protein SpmB
VSKVSGDTVSQSREDGHKAKTRAIIFALLGFFAFAGVIFGALAIWQARKAEAAGVRARLWMIIGIIDVVFSTALILSHQLPT